jgi:DNA-binding NarL/FixJ family response regulator
MQGIRESAEDGKGMIKGGRVMDNISILVIDDDELVVMSLEMIINAADGLTVTGKGYSGEEAIRLYDELSPDVLLMDIRMKDMTGLDAAQQILAKHPKARILFLTTFSDEEYIVKALTLGVKGYLLKQDYKSVGASIKAVYNGQNVFGGAVVEKLPGLIHSGKQEDSGKNPETAGNTAEGSGESDEQKYERNYLQKGITEREYELIQLIAQGLSNKEIAEKIFLSEGTVKNYLSTILDKLDLRDRTQLAVYYFKNR